MELKQRRLFSEQHFRFDDSTLHLFTSNLVSGKRAWSVRLDEINPSYTVRQIGLFSNGCLSATAVIIVSTLLIVSLPWLTSLIVLVISLTPLFIGRLVHNYNYIQFETKRGPFLIGYSKSQKTEADRFVASLQAACAKYLKWKYGTPDPDLNKEKQIENFWWLRNHGVISDQEYGELKSVLKPKPSQ
jgi:hypothetical protein